MSGSVDLGSRCGPLSRRLVKPGCALAAVRVDVSIRPTDRTRWAQRGLALSPPTARRRPTRFIRARCSSDEREDPVAPDGSRSDGGALTARGLTNVSRLTRVTGDPDPHTSSAFRGQTLPGAGAGPGGSGSNLPSLIRPQQAKRVLVEARHQSERRALPHVPAGTSGLTIASPSQDSRERSR